MDAFPSAHEDPPRRRSSAGELDCAALSSARLVMDRNGVGIDETAALQGASYHDTPGPASSISTYSFARTTLCLSLASTADTCPTAAEGMLGSGS